MLSIIYLTYRHEPHFEWFLDSLDLQCKARKGFSRSNIQLIFVDGYFWSQDGLANPAARKKKLNDAIAGRFSNYLHVAPKPSPFQGPDRLTADEYFCAANSRNTGVCYAKHNFIVFVDDLTVLMPTWLKTCLRAVKANDYLIAGAYKKVNHMVVEKGVFMEGEIRASGVDHRWKLGGDDVKVIELGGGQLYGCSFGMPIEYYLEINGQNELCDSLGGEDYEFGIRLAKKGHKILYNKEMLTYEADELHHLQKTPNMLRDDPKTDKEYYMKMWKKHGMDKHGAIPTHTVWDFSHFLLDMALYNENSYVSNHNVNLKQLRQSYLKTGKIKFKREWPGLTHFFTGEDLRTFGSLSKVLQKINEIVPNMQGWCPVDKAQIMAKLVIKSKAQLCVELGVFAGRSLLPMGLALQHSGGSRLLYGIDAWSRKAVLEGKNDESNDDWWGKIDFEHFYQYTQQHIKEHNLQSYVKLIRESSLEAHDLFEDESIDVLHQDSNHSEEISCSEVKLWTGKLRAGGYWIFDDTDWETTQKAQRMLETEYNFKLIEDHQKWRIYMK